MERGRGDRRRRARRGAAPAGRGRSAERRRSPRRGSPPPSTTPCASGAPRTAPSRRSSPPGRTRPSPTPGPATADLEPATRWSSTSVPSFDGYRSDMTRTFCVGGEPTGELAAVFEVVADVAARRGGGGARRRRGGDVDRGVPASRSPTPGWAERFEHGTGHGVGLDIHEAPSVGAGSTAILEPGTVVTVEPGRVPARRRWGPHRGHPRRDRRRQPPAHPVPEGSRRLMAVSTNDLRNGMTLEPARGPVHVVEFQHVKPGKGGAFVRTKLQEPAHRSGHRAHLPCRREARAGDHRQAGDAVPLPGRRRLRVHGHRPPTSSCRWRPASLGDAANYLKEGDDAVLQFFGTEIVGVDLPAAVELTVTETEPGLQGDRVSGARKPATLETGLVIQVPLFVEPGREDQGGHPDRRVPDPGLSPPAAGRIARGPIAATDHGPRTPSPGPRTGARPALRGGPEGRAAPAACSRRWPGRPRRRTRCTLVRAVACAGTEIDELVGGAAIGWDLDRMAVVDRNVLRLAMAELLEPVTTCPPRWC